MSVVTFTTDQVIKEISNCSNTKAFGPDKLSIFQLKNLEPYGYLLSDMYLFMEDITNPDSFV